MDRAADLRMPRLSFARVVPRRAVHVPSRTVRLRLTLLYSGLFLVSGVTLLAATYLIFRTNTGVDLIVPNGPSHGSNSTSGEGEGFTRICDCRPKADRKSRRRVVQFGTGFRLSLIHISEPTRPY